MKYPPIYLFALPFVAGVLNYSLGWSRPWANEPTIVEELKLAIFVFVAGTFFYSIRCQYTRMYGVLEIIVGVIICWYLVHISFDLVSSKANSAFATLAALMPSCAAMTMSIDR